MLACGMGMAEEDVQEGGEGNASQNFAHSGSTGSMDNTVNKFLHH